MLLGERYLPFLPFAGPLIAMLPIGRVRSGLGFRSYGCGLSFVSWLDATEITSSLVSFLRVSFSRP